MAIMQVSEIFYSIQGEGFSAGVPAIFLRLSGCHLRCTWCDSKFTWDRTSGDTMSNEEIIATIKEYPCKRLVITGGEPLLQQSALKELLEVLNKEYFIEMETSGSLETFLNESIDQYNCSPKLSNSGNTAIKYDKSLQSFPKEKTYFKFVVNEKEDMGEIKDFLNTNKISHEKVFLMPQGISKEEIEKRSRWITEICKSENFNFSPRLHISIWGNKRGV